MQCLDSLESAWIGLHGIISPHTTGIVHKSSDTVSLGRSVLSLATLLDCVDVWRVGPEVWPIPYDRNRAQKLSGWHLLDSTRCSDTVRQYKMVCTGTSQYVPYSIKGRTRNLEMVHTSMYQHRYVPNPGRIWQNLKW